MKRVVYAGSRLSRIGALRAIADTLRSDPSYTDCRIEVNDDHRCVDVFYSDGTMDQVYAKPEVEYDSYGYRYVKVDPGEGDYIRQRYPRSRTAWSTERGQTKKVTSY